jgi:hypothetical protein
VLAEDDVEDEAVPLLLFVVLDETVVIALAPVPP